MLQSMGSQRVRHELLTKQEQMVSAPPREARIVGAGGGGGGVEIPRRQNLRVLF